MTHAFDVASFRSQFPEFANSTTYTDNQLSAYWSMAIQYISPEDGYVLSGDVLQLALNLLTAHLAKSFTMINAGQTTAIVNGSSEGSVSVSLTPPPAKNAFQWWLATTPYGMQLRSILSIKSAAGFYIGGLPERSAYRKVGGVF